MHSGAAAFAGAVSAAGIFQRTLGGNGKAKAGAKAPH